MLKKLLSYLKLAPSNLSKENVLRQTKRIKFGTKISVIFVFWTEVSKTLLLYLKSEPSRLSKMKFLTVIVNFDLEFAFSKCPNWLSVKLKIFVWCLNSLLSTFLACVLFQATYWFSSTHGKVNFVGLIQNCEITSWHK